MPTEHSTPIRLISKQRAAEMLGCHPVHLMRIAGSDLSFPRPVKFGASTNCRVHFDLAEIEQWIASRAARCWSTQQ
jgi:predicted DNA-binding transcriptional regulator AlpA